MTKKVKQRWHFREIFIFLYLGNHIFCETRNMRIYVRAVQQDAIAVFAMKSHMIILFGRRCISCIFIFYLWWRVCLCPIDWSVSDNHVDEPISMQLSQFHHLPCIRIIVVVTVWTAIPIYVLKTIFTVTTFFVATRTSSISTISY